MTSLYKPVDALGDDIVIGAMYGYSSSKACWARTVVGVARGFTKTGMITLVNVKVKQFLGGVECTEPFTLENADHVSIRPHMVFPVLAPSPKVKADD